MFVGRTALLDFVQQLVSVAAGPATEAESARPLLVVEGCGGSGRSALLEQVHDRWAEGALIGVLDARLLPGRTPQVPQPMLPAALLALSRVVPGFEKVAFRRVVLAHIAMDAPITGSLGAAKAALAARIALYGRGGEVVKLMDGLTQAVVRSIVTAGTATTQPDLGAQVGPVLAEAASRSIVGRLQRGRLLRKLEWGQCVEWFGHQGIGLKHDPQERLVLLSQQARVLAESVRRDVDDLLVRALLADLRDGMASVANRPSNAVLLVDSADGAQAAAFLSALVRVRQTQGAEPDPLTVVATSGGRLVPELARHAPYGVRLPEAELAGLAPERVARCGWAAVRLGPLAAADVRQLVGQQLWPASLGTGVIAAAVQRVSGGHPAAVELVLRDLRTGDAEKLVDRLAEVLDRPSSTPGLAVDAALADEMLTGALGFLDRDVRDGLTTLSAARHLDEAEQLLADEENPVPGDRDLLRDGALWAGADDGDSPVLWPYLRYLLLRRLAQRPDDDPASWATVFDTLLSKAVDAEVSDLAGLLRLLVLGDLEPVAAVLHHRLALGDVDQVCAVLTGALTMIDGAEWLSLLDAAVATPGLRPGWSDGDRPDGRGTAASVRSLLVHEHRLRDPGHGARDERRHSCRVVKRSYGRLSDLVADRDRRLFADRADRAERDEKDLL